MVYKVKNMSCRHCVMRIEEVMKKNAVKGVVDLATKSVTSEDDRVPEILRSIGYITE